MPTWLPGRMHNIEEQLNEGPRPSIKAKKTKAKQKQSKRTARQRQHHVRPAEGTSSRHLWLINYYDERTRTSTLALGCALLAWSFPSCSGILLHHLPMIVIVLYLLHPPSGGLMILYVCSCVCIVTTHCVTDYLPSTGYSCQPCSWSAQ